MHLRSFYLALVVHQAVALPYVLPNLTSGFLNSTISSAFGNSTTCVSGLIPVPVTATTVKLLVPEPANQTVATELIQELLQINSTIVARSNGGSNTIRETYNIDATLCLPKDPARAQSVKTVQVLTYGIGLDKSYWDIALGYSYVSATAEAGYATLAYDRLGVGKSDHPDPIQVVQATVDVEILHGLVRLLRSGHVGPGHFKNVIGVGHSFGSILQLAQTAKYPQDVDAAVLTSFTNKLTNLPYTNLANNPAIANQNDPIRFHGLPNGYIVDDTPISVQLPFFRFPFYEQRIFENQYAAKSTYTVGQSFTLGGIYSPAPAFKGPVDLVISRYDFPFCLGDCTNPTNQVAETISQLYPAAGNGSQSYIVPDCGHYINAHYAAAQEFSQINKFLQSNGF